MLSSGRIHRGIMVAFFLASVWGCLFQAVPAQAIGVWVEGRVTKNPYFEGEFQYLEVDRLRYLLMPEVPVLQWTMDRKGIGHEDPTAMSNVRTGKRVNVKVQGYRIYRIIILK